MNIGKLLLILSLALTSLQFSPVSRAEAGRVVFAYGDVTAQGNDGVVRYLNKRDQVEAGDVIRTANRSLVQIRMIDKAFIALRSNSEFKIEAYQLGAKKEEDVGIFSLIKGGFRAVTGIIGKRLRSAYKMRTVNATIGIRGTDYTARLCNKDCNKAFGNLSSANSIADGLYVGVNQGGINLTNQLGTLDLDELQFGYVKDATTAPVALLSAPEFLYFNSRPPNPDADQASSSEAESVTETAVASRAVVVPASSDITNSSTIQQDLKSELVAIPQDEVEDTNVHEQVAQTASGAPVPLNSGTIESSRMVVTSYGKDNTAGSISAVNANPFSAAEIANGNLQAFENDSIDFGVGQYTQGTTSAIELGFDPQTGIAWGRWNGGTAQFQPGNGATENLGFNNSSLHWVTGPDRAQTIALPSNGTAGYRLVGNTSPTDNLGNVGILGTATLNADFTNMTVDPSVAIGINNQVWNGDGSNLPISANGGFSGALDVSVDGAAVGPTGTAAGFFTDNANGAGMGFSLESGATTVTGTATFQKN